MPNVATTGTAVKAKASAATAPKLSESLRRLLADPFRMEGEGLVDWQPPDVPPETAKLRAAASEIEIGLKPATPGHIEWCCNKLFVLPTRDGSAMSAAFMTDNFIDVCGQFPDDLWSTGTLELLRANTFRPTPAEMFKIVAPKFAERRRMLDRINMMIGGQPTPEKATAPKFVATAARDRLRKILAEQRDKPYADESHRVHDMAHAERALAFEERRWMADWAQRFFDDRVAAQGGPAVDGIGKHAKAAATRNSPTNRRMAGIAAAKREGRWPAPTEEPPPIEDIPEVRYGDAR